MLPITQYLLTFLISYVNILTYYCPPAVAGKFLNTYISSHTHELLIFATFAVDPLLIRAPNDTNLNSNFM